MSTILAFLAAHKIPVLVGSLCTTVVGGGAAVVSLLYGDTKKEQLPNLDLRREEELELDLEVLTPQDAPLGEVTLPLHVEQETEEDGESISSAQVQAAQAKRRGLEEKTSGFITISRNILRDINRYSSKRGELEQCLKKNETKITLGQNHINELFQAKEKLEQDITSAEAMLKNVKEDLKNKESAIDGNRRKEELEKFEQELSNLETNYETIENKNSAKEFTTKWNNFLNAIKVDQEKCGIKDLIRLNEQKLEPQRQHNQ